METREPDPDEPQAPDPGPTRPAGAEGGAPPPGGGTHPRRLVRSRENRVIGGVCAGIARYLGVDPLIIRATAAALVLLGGLGAFLYVGALLLLPDDDGPALADATTTRGRLLTVLGVVALVGAAAVVLSGAVLGSLGVLVPLSFLALAGLVVWWLVSGEGLSGSGRDVARRSALGLGVLLLSAVIFAAGGWAVGTGGGTLAAALVIGAGAAVALGAFVHPVRWLVLPALGLALGAGIASAADLDLRGGAGEREYRPLAATDVRDHYRLGVGRLVVDLRRAQLDAGDVPLELEVGMGQAVVLVAEDVCVATRARVAMGGVQVFGRDNAGIDLDWEDRPVAPSGVTRLVVDAHVGFGGLEVRHDEDPGYDGPFGHRRHRRGGDLFEDGEGNLACAPGSGGARA
jgi:phage shock protein PspC (stress-responsive transcriptional regulator)